MFYLPHGFVNIYFIFEWSIYSKYNQIDYIVNFV